MARAPVWPALESIDPLGSINISVNEFNTEQAVDADKGFTYENHPVNYGFLQAVWVLSFSTRYRV